MPFFFSSLSLRKVPYFIFLAIFLSGCANGRDPTFAKAPDYPEEYTQRHPIVLGDFENKLDIFLVPNNKSFSSTQRERIKSFLERYRTRGRGGLRLMLPLSAPKLSERKTLEKLYRLIRQARIPRRAVRISKEKFPGQRLPFIRLIFVERQARLKEKCGFSPYEPIFGGSLMSRYKNKPGYNFGCAYQSIFAAQVADPEDFVHSRANAPSDLASRLGDIQAVRDQKNPATSWGEAAEIESK